MFLLLLHALIKGKLYYQIISIWLFFLFQEVNTFNYAASNWIRVTSESAQNQAHRILRIFCICATCIACNRERKMSFAVNSMWLQSKFQRKIYEHESSKNNATLIYYCMQMRYIRIGCHVQSSRGTLEDFLVVYCFQNEMSHSATLLLYSVGIQAQNISLLW